MPAVNVTLMVPEVAPAVPSVAITAVPPVAVTAEEAKPAAAV